MSFFNNFPSKTLYEVSVVLVNFQLDSILNFIGEDDDGYYLNNTIESISSLPSYQFAVACSLACLGNSTQAEQILSDPDSFIEGLPDNSPLKDMYHAFTA